jgi:hypothetical protein
MRVERAPVLGTLLLSCLWVACGQTPELTASRAAAIIREELSEPILTTFLNPMKLGHCVDRTRYLVYCESAGLAKVNWVHHDPPCGDFTVELTEQGEDYFTDLQFTGLPDAVHTTKGWQATLRSPIVARLIEVTRLLDVSPGRKRVEFTLKHEFPTSLSGCTRHSQPGVQSEAVYFTLVGNEWRLE